ncbi:MAG: NUDIX hydrolase [Minisyncoccia bacterium]
MNRSEILGYKPIGKPLPSNLWVDLTNSSWKNDERGGTAFVHVLFFEGEDVFFVLNGKDKKYEEQKPGWKLPTEEVGNGEIPYETARRAVREEVYRKISDQFEIDRKPIWVSKDKHGHFHFVFVGSIKPGVNIPEKCEDVAHEVTEVKFVNLAEIKVTPDPEKSGCNKLSLDGVYVLPISIGLISLTMN